MPIARFAAAVAPRQARRILGAALLLSALCACGRHSSAGGRGGPQQAPYVATIVATQGAIYPASSLAGIIAPYENVAIQTTLVEPADAVYVQEGDRVHRGEILAQLDTADLRAELASDVASTTHTYYEGGLSISQSANALRQAETTLRTDQLNLERDQSLLRQGYIARQTADAQLEVVRNDEQTVDSDRSAVSANGTLGGSGLEAAAVAQARAQADQVRVQISTATITSPIDGVVVNRNLNPGEYPGNRQIFTLQQVDPIFAIVRGSGAQIAHIAMGSQANVVVSDLDAHLTGRVVGVLNEIVPGSTDFQVKILVNNPQRRLRPGMTVVANVALPSLHGVRIPETAFTDQNHTQIMTVNANDIVEVTRVDEIGNDGTTSVIAGIASGTRVVSNGMASVGSGEKVSLK